jgi:hypothetical protein
MATHTEPYNESVFDNLLHRFRMTPEQELQQRWLLLESAHVVGQSRLLPHLRIHVSMLGVAWRARDWTDVAGQIFRIVPAPIGHLTGRLPLGNPGRSNISAFKTMTPKPEISQLISESAGVIRTLGH